jgi:very-short-patch-repair endonuclease
MERKMFYKANPLLFAKAKEMRNNPTHTEMVLWSYLKTKPFGYKFRRQHPLGNYIVDFFCYKLKLVIEADGRIHQKEDIRKYDEERDRYIKEKGIFLLRVANDEVKSNLDQVIETISILIKIIINYLNEGYVNTPPSGGRGVI